LHREGLDILNADFLYVSGDRLHGLQEVARRDARRGESAGAA
jgi:hypothetical protein